MGSAAGVSGVLGRRSRMPAAAARSRARPPRIQPLVLGPGVVVGVGVDGLAEAAAELGGVGVAVGVDRWRRRWRRRVFGCRCAPWSGFWVSRGSWPAPESVKPRDCAGGDVAGDVGLGGGFVGDGGVGRCGVGLEGHALGQHDGDGVGRHGRVWGEGEAAAVGKAVGDLEAGFAGADGEEEGVVALLGERDGGGLDGHAAGGERGGAFDYGAFGEDELEGAVGELGERWSGLVLDEEVFDDAEAVVAGVGLDAHDVGFAGDAFDLRGGVVDVDFDGLGAGRRGAEVVGLVVGDADEVDALVGHGEGEVAAGVGLGAGGLLHALLEADEDDVVAGGGLVGRLVGDDAGDVVGGESREREEEERAKGV